MTVNGLLNYDMTDEIDQLKEWTRIERENNSHGHREFKSLADLRAFQRGESNGLAPQKRRTYTEFKPEDFGLRYAETDAQPIKRKLYTKRKDSKITEQVIAIILASDKKVSVLAKELGIDGKSIRKIRKDAADK